jgi:hypothetical protein
MSIHREVTLTLLSFELRWMQAEPAAGGQFATKRKALQRRANAADTSPTYHRHTQSADRIDPVEQVESGIAVSRGSFVSTPQSLIGHLTYCMSNMVRPMHTKNPASVANPHGLVLCGHPAG